MLRQARPLAALAALLCSTSLPLASAVRLSSESEESSLESSNAAVGLSERAAYSSAVEAFVQEKRAKAEEQLKKSRREFAETVVQDVAALALQGKQQHEGGLGATNHEGNVETGEDREGSAGLLAGKVSGHLGKYKEKARRVSNEFRAQLMGNIDDADAKIDEAKKEFIDVFIEEVAKYKEEASISKQEAERELQEELQNMEEEAKKRSCDEVVKREQMVARMKQGEAQLAKLLSELAGMPAAMPTPRDSLQEASIPGDPPPPPPGHEMLSPPAPPPPPPPPDPSPTAGSYNLGIGLKPVVQAAGYILGAR